MVDSELQPARRRVTRQRRKRGRELSERAARLRLVGVRRCVDEGRPHIHDEGNALPFALGQTDRERLLRRAHAGRIRRGAVQEPDVIDPTDRLGHRLAVEEKSRRPEDDRAQTLVDEHDPDPETLRGDVGRARRRIGGQPDLGLFPRRAPADVQARHARDHADEGDHERHVRPPSQPGDPASQVLGGSTMRGPLTLLCHSGHDVRSPGERQSVSLLVIGTRACRRAPARERPRGDGRDGVAPLAFVGRAGGACAVLLTPEDRQVAR